MAKEISITYRLSMSEFMRACEYHWHAQRLGTASYVVSGALVSSAGIVLWLLFNWFWPSLILVISGAFLIGLVGIRRVLWRKAFRDARKYQSEISLSFSDKDVHVETLEGTSDLNWGFYSWFLETPEHILLYMTKHTFSVIPKSAFNDSQTEDEFRQLVMAKLPAIKS